MTSADREKFFRQRVLSKLFPSEEESDSEVDEDTTKQLHSPVGTESEELHDVACKGQKRKLSERDGHQSLAPNSGVSLQNEENTPSYSSQQLYTVEKPVLFSSPRSLRVSQDLSAAHKTLHQSSAKECEDQAARSTGSQLTESTQPPSKLSKNQKRKLKKKRHKERVRSNRDEQTTPAPKEFTYETG